MKLPKLTLAAAIACGAIGSPPALTADSPSCSSIHFAQDFVKAYPNAPAACRAVVTKNGKNLVKFTAVVKEQKGDAVTVRFLNVRDEEIQSSKDLTFTPKPDLQVSVNGKKTAVKDLKKGDVLNIYVPESAQGVMADPEDINIAPIVMK